MQEIKPSVDDRGKLCAETVAGPSALVVFGASGDLTHRKLLVSMFNLFTQELLDDKFYLLGCGRKKFSDEEFRKTAQMSIRDSSDFLSSKSLDAFVSRLYYIDGNYDDAGLYERMGLKIVELNQKYNVGENIVFYLAVPPFLYTRIVEHLGSAGLACTTGPVRTEQAKLVVEKPFGRNLQSAGND